MHIILEAKLDDPLKLYNTVLVKTRLKHWKEIKAK